MKALVHLTFLNGEAVGPFIHSLHTWEPNNIDFTPYSVWLGKDQYPLETVKEICIKPLPDSSESVLVQDAPMQHQNQSAGTNQPS